MIAEALGHVAEGLSGSDIASLYGLDFSSPIGAVQKCVLEGDSENIGAAVFRALETHTPEQVISEGLIKSMQIIGRLWDEGIYFLPETLMAAEAMERAIKICEEKMGHPREKKGTVITHTAEGDIHDLGQKLVNVLLRASGYEVVDLGKDVPASRVVEAVKEYKPLMLTGTALMTTTAPVFRQIARRLKLLGLELPFVCGGSAVTMQYAHSFDLGIHGREVFQAPVMADEVRSGKSWREIREGVAKP